MIGIKKIEDWYQVKAKDIIQHGGTSLLNKFGNSPSKLISSTFPNFKWNINKFKSMPHLNFMPHGYWNDIHNQKVKLNEIGKMIGIKKIEDWYRVKPVEIVSHGG